MRYLKTILERLSQKPHGQWDWYETPSGPVMRRYIDGRIEERQMTKEEEQDYLASRAGW